MYFIPKDWNIKTFFYRSKSQHQLGRQAIDGGSSNKGNGFSTLPRRLQQHKTISSNPTLPRSSSATRAYPSQRQSTPSTKAHNRYPAPPMQPTLSSLMRSSRSVSSGLSKMTINGAYSRSQQRSNTSTSISSNSRQNTSSDEISKIEDGKNNDSKESVREDQTPSKAEGARPKTPGGARRSNKLKQGKTLSTSMEIWQIQKELKRGEMVQVRKHKTFLFKLFVRSIIKFRKYAEIIRIYCTLIRFGP